MKEIRLKWGEETKKLEVFIRKIEYEVRQQVIGEMQEAFEELESMYKACNSKLVHQYEEIIHRKNEIYNDRIKTILESKQKNMQDKALSPIKNHQDSSTMTETSTSEKSLQTFHSFTKSTIPQVCLPFSSSIEQKENPPSKHSKSSILELRPRKATSVRANPVHSTPVARRTRKALRRLND